MVYLKAQQQQQRKATYVLVRKLQEGLKDAFGQTKNSQI